jgi:replicative DNA helicase
MNQLMRTGFEKDEYFGTLLKYVDKMKDYPIYIDDKPALTVPEMKRKARAMKRKNNIQLLVIDFLQMFSGDKEVRINVGEAARECKNLAKELNIPVIGLSQISREVRKSKYFIPKKYHLKEASAIEEAADIIGMLYRPSYYGYERASSAELYDDVLGLQGEENAVLMVEKNRNGSLGNVGLQYIENKTKFVNGCVVDDSTPF